MNGPATFSVLIVEDHADLAANIADFLESHGHQVDVAQDGVTGLHLAVPQPHDVIVLDLMLPGIDGLTLFPPPATSTRMRNWRALSR